MEEEDLEFRVNSRVSRANKKAMHSLLKNLPKDIRRKLKKKRQPSWTAPMLATLTDERFSDPNWIFERKLDGERVLVFRQGTACAYSHATGSCLTTRTQS